MRPSLVLSVGFTVVFLAFISSWSGLFLEAKGLREHFTWTRINYQWPTSTQQNSGGRLKRNEYGNGSDDRGSVSKSGSTATNSTTTTNDRIVFPGSTAGNPSSSSSNHHHQQHHGSDSNRPGYIYENNIPMGANRWHNKLFVTVPRRRDGVPSTLNYVPYDSNHKHNVLLIPYPDWETNRLTGSSGHFVSVYRVAVDYACDRLWFVDTGMIEIPGNITQVRPTTLVVMDLKSDRIISEYPIPTEQLSCNTNLALLTVDSSARNCADAFAYIPDLAGYALLVYSLQHNRSWRVRHNYFYLEPQSGDFRIAGHDFQWNDGIFSIALGTPHHHTGFRDAYFHSMAGTHVYRVNTQILRNESLATRPYHGSDSFHVVGDRGQLAQTSASAMHNGEHDILFLGLVNQDAVGCWLVGTPPRLYGIVQKDSKRMIYPSDVKVTADAELIVLTNTMPGFLYGHLDYNQTNFRVWTQDVRTAVSGTSCEPTSNTNNGRPY